MSHPLLERLIENVDMTTSAPCWLWTAGRSSGGYGMLRANGKPVYTHRVAYEIWKGPIPEGLTIDHLCRVRACCNPAHLEAVTNQTNILRGAGFAAVHAATTHCPRGHALVAENLVQRHRERARHARAAGAWKR